MMQSFAHNTPLGGEQQPQRAHRSKTNSSVSSMTEAGADGIVRSATSDVKCPELLVLGADLQKKAPLQKLYKKVRIALYSLVYSEDADIGHTRLKM